MELLIDGVSFGYSGGERILSDVSLALSSGTVLGILGPNGSGKTTLIKLLTGASRPDAGKIALDGVAISSMSARHLARKMALVAQKSEMSFDFAALDVVLMGRQPYLKRFETESAEDIRIARESMDKLGVLHLENRRVSMLSGGELQRVIIARALCQRAGILLLDEPVSNLDIRHQIETLRLVRALAREDGVACACVLHDINLAAHYCDRLCVLHGGRVYACGTPAQVLSAEMLRDVYAIEARVETGVDGVPEIKPVYG